jgi:hypothetical protein
MTRNMTSLWRDVYLRDEYWIVYQKLTLILSESWG